MVLSLMNMTLIFSAGAALLEERSITCTALPAVQYLLEGVERSVLHPVLDLLFALISYSV